MLRLCGVSDLAFFPVMPLLYFKKQHHGKKSASFPIWNVFLQPPVNTSLRMFVKVNGRFKGLQIYCRTSHMGFSSCPWSFVLALYHSKESQILSKPEGLLMLSSFADAV